MGTFLRFRPKPRRYVQEDISTVPVNATYWQPVAAVLWGRRNQVIAHAALADTPKFATNATLANAGTLTVWTPTAGNVAQINTITLAVSNAGGYNILVNGATIAVVFLAANSTFTIPYGCPGYFAYPASSVIAVQNNSGAVSNTSVGITGTEVLA